MDLGQPKPRAVRHCLVAYLASWVIALTAAQDFAPVPSCTSDLSSFAGIVCSGDAITGSVIHCVFNGHFQAGQVCSPWQSISEGHCPRYLEKDGGIDEFACIGYDLCPREKFRSYEVYKYPACLNRSLYINESTTTPADTTKQPRSCIDCADRNNTGQSMSLAVPFGITVAVLTAFFVALFCLVMVWEYRTGKLLLGVICGCLKNGCCSHRTTDNEQVAHREAEQGMTNEEEDMDHQEEQV